jgi:hypothetical protein
MVRSSEIILIRKTGLKRSLAVVCALFLSLYLGTILPAHHHSDGQPHEECALCLVQHQPSSVEAVFSVLPVESLVENVLLISATKYEIPCALVYQTRAPPSINSTNS